MVLKFSTGVVSQLVQMASWGTGLEPALHLPYAYLGESCNLNYSIGTKDCPAGPVHALLSSAAVLESSFSLVLSFFFPSSPCAQQTRGSSLTSPQTSGYPPFFPEASFCGLET